MIKRLLDIAISLIGLIFFSPILLFVSILVWSNDKKSPLYIPPRVGKKGTIFYMVKLRSMVLNADKAGINSTSNNDLRITSIGQKIRKYKLDELTQLWNVFLGDMSLVGPRPALFNQDDLIALRTDAGVHELLPGLTGWAQVNGRDELSIPDKVKLDAEYLEKRSFGFDLWILWLTLLRVLRRDGVSH